MTPARYKLDFVSLACHHTPMSCRTILLPLVLLPVFLATSSCGGYHFVHGGNPFEEYGIESVSIPMFFNKSTLPHVSAPFTAEFFNLLASYPELEVHSGLNPAADAVLLGIISSPHTLKETVAVEATKRAKTLVEEKDLGARRDFFTPSRNQVELELRVVLIKNPNWREVEFFQTDLGQKVKKHPKLIFNRKIALTESFDREFRPRDKGGVTNFTSNLQTRSGVVKTLALDARKHFKEVVIGAF